MSFPYYVSPEQMMQDRAEYAQKGIEKGRSILALEYKNGILMVADNPSQSLKKISEIYDTVAFLGAGKYSEFENLRKAGIQHADLKGYMYSREDVTAKSLANSYSQALGTAFSQDVKPLEVEIAVVGVSESGSDDEIYRISFDGSIIDEDGVTAIGGKSEPILSFLKDKFKRGLSLGQAAGLAKTALEQEQDEAIPVESLEAAILDRTCPGRKFRRLAGEELTGLFKKAKS
ncbi:MAG TPA: proteasome subunit alpha [Nitrospiria bacterium]